MVISQGVLSAKPRADHADPAALGPAPRSSYPTLSEPIEEINPPLKVVETIAPPDEISERVHEKSEIDEIS
jgi:hypothetical protein